MAKGDTSICPSLHLWTSGVCARGRASLSPSLLIPVVMDLQLCFWERQALAGDGGNEASLWPQIWDWDQTSVSEDHTAQAKLMFFTFHVMSPSLFHSLFFPTSFTLLFSAIVTLPRWALRHHPIRCLTGIVILGTWEIKSLLMSDDAPVLRCKLPFVLIETDRVPSYGPQGCLCTAVSSWSSQVTNYFMKTL